MASFVITASVFVDGVDSPEDADNAVEASNDHGVIEVRLPDPDSEYRWEKISD